MKTALALIVLIASVCQAALPATQPATAPAVFTNGPSMLAGLPKESSPHKGEGWNKLLVSMANRWLNENVAGGHFKGKLQVSNLNVQATGIDGMATEAGFTAKGGVAIAHVYYDITFQKDEQAKLAHHKDKSSLTVEGVIQHVELNGAGKTASMDVRLIECTSSR